MTLFGRYPTRLIIAIFASAARLVSPAAWAWAPCGFPAVASGGAGKRTARPGHPWGTGGDPADDPGALPPAPGDGVSHQDHPGVVERPDCQGHRYSEALLC